MDKQLTSGKVQIEEIAVQQSLDRTGYQSYMIHVTFEIISISPVEEVQSSVGA